MWPRPRAPPRRRARSASRRAWGAEGAVPWIRAAAENRCFLGRAAALRGRFRGTPRPRSRAVETNCRVACPVRRAPPRGCRARLAGTPQFSLSPGSPSESQSIQLLGVPKRAALLSGIQACVSLVPAPLSPRSLHSRALPPSGSGGPGQLRDPCWGPGGGPGAGPPGEGTLCTPAPLEPLVTMSPSPAFAAPPPKEKRSCVQESAQGRFKLPYTPWAVGSQPGSLCQLPGLTRPRCPSDHMGQLLPPGPRPAGLGDTLNVLSGLYDEPASPKAPAFPLWDPAALRSRQGSCVCSPSLNSGSDTCVRLGQVTGLSSPRKAAGRVVPRPWRPGVSV